MEHPNRQAHLVDSSLQRKLALIFGLGGFCAVLTVTLLYGHALDVAAGRLPSDGGQLRAQIGGMMLRNLVLGSALVVPLFVVLSLAVSSRLLGPLRRFRAYLEELAAGRRVEPCELGRNEEFQGFCELLNLATAGSLMREDNLSVTESVKLAGEAAEDLTALLPTTRAPEHAQRDSAES